MPIITATNLTIGNSLTSGVTSYNTASITPDKNALVLAFVVNRRTNNGPSNVPVLSGAGLTWTNLVNSQSSDSVKFGFGLYRALSPTPGSGPITIDAGVQQQSQSAWAIIQLKNIDTSGVNGANAVVQFNNGEQSGSATPSVALSTFGNANNATVGFCFENGLASITPGSGFTQLGFVSNSGVLSEWASNNHTTIGFSKGSTNQALMIAAEIKAMKTFLGGML